MGPFFIVVTKGFIGAGVELVCERATKSCACEREGTHVKLHPCEHHPVFKEVAALEEDS